MPELRRGPLTDRWVIIAPERTKRPSDYRSKETEEKNQDLKNCPFCPGNEHMPPPEIYRTGGGDERWRVRVVPNKFPSLQDYPQLDRAAVAGAFERMNGAARTRGGDRFT